MKASAALFLILAFSGIAILSYILYNEVFTNEILEEPKHALAYDTTDASPEMPPETVLNVKTGVLGLTVYGTDREILGVLYDVYATPDTGEIQWVSVDVQQTRRVEEGDEPQAELILVSVAELSEFADEGPIVVNAATEQFFDWPFQKKHEERLENLVSLRSLPESPVRDANGKLMGTVERVSFADHRINEIFFEAAETEFNESAQYFSVPFTTLNINVSYDQTTNSTEITLTERQAGAIEAYLNDE